MTTLPLIFLATGLMVLIGFVMWRAVNKKLDAWYKLIDQDYKILVHNKRALNRNELLTFSMKEYGAWLHDIHRDVLTVVSKLEPADQVQLDTFNRVLSCLQGTLHAIDDNFYRTFNCTPEQYMADKSHVTYRSKTTGKDVSWRDDLGVN